MMYVQLVDELREVADWFRVRGLDENTALLDQAAHTVQCAANFFAWFNKYYPEPSSHPQHEWCVLGVALTPDSAGAALPKITNRHRPAKPSSPSRSD